MKVAFSLRHENARVTSLVAVSETAVFSGGSDGNVNMWNPQTGVNLRRYCTKGIHIAFCLSSIYQFVEDKAVTSLKVTSDLVIAVVFTNVYLFDRESTESLCCLRGVHSGDVISAQDIGDGIFDPFDYSEK